MLAVVDHMGHRVECPSCGLGYDSEVTRWIPVRFWGLLPERISDATNCRSRCLSVAASHSSFFGLLAVVLGALLGVAEREE